MKKFGLTTLGLVSPLWAFAQESTEQKIEQLDKILNNETIKLAIQSRADSPVEILVPITFFLLILGVVFIAHYLRYKQNIELQTTIRLMVEKGTPVPLELIVPKETNTNYLKDMRRGLVLTLLGVTIPLAWAVSDPAHNNWVWGLIPLALGVAYIISARINKNAQKNG